MRKIWLPLLICASVSCNEPADSTDEALETEEAAAADETTEETTEETSEETSEESSDGESTDTAGDTDGDGTTDAAAEADTTAPPAPASIDDGIRFASLTQSPEISWVAPADATDIASYEVALGTTEGGTDLVDWTDAGTNLTHQFTVTIGNGINVFASVRSKDAAGNLSEAVNGDGIKTSSVHLE